MITEKKGKVVKGLGGLYETRVSEDGTVTLFSSRAKGALRRDDERVLVGDDVIVTIDDSTPDGIVISEVLPRRNSLIRPPLANLDYLFIVFAARKPVPVLETVDKLIAIAEHNGIVPVVVVTKSDMDDVAAEEYAAVYSSIGIPTFVTSSKNGSGTAALSSYIHENIRCGATSAFAGASGVGKSTLMNSLFPHLGLATAEISRKIERGRHTTRHVELFAIDEGDETGFLADTPGFSLIDFERFDFFSLEDLADSFRELRAYRGACTYADCSHVGEGSTDCAVARDAERGIIPASRLESYRSIYRVLKQKSQDYTKK